MTLVCASAQVPSTLLRSIPAPPSSAEIAGHLGSSVAIDGNYTVVGAPYDDTGNIDAGVAKVFDSTTGVQLFTLTNPAPTRSWHFGRSVSISGSRVAVAGDVFPSFLPTGAAFVYDLEGNTPTVPVFSPPKQYQPSSPLSVAISGARLAIWGKRGPVHVFDLGGLTPLSPVATLTIPGSGNELDDPAVAISGNLVVIGTPKAQANVGRVYVYNLSGSLSPILGIPNPAPGWYLGFGKAVAISGTRLIAGGAGRAFAFDMTRTNPTIPVATLTNPSLTQNESFGDALAISGTAVVVSRYEKMSGSVYAYELASATPGTPVTLPPPGSALNGGFGYAVAISGARAVVGAPDDDSARSDAGGAYFYDLSNGSPMTPMPAMHRPPPAPSDLFGSSVALSGGLLVVGVPHDDASAWNAGRVQIYDLKRPGPLVPVLTIPNPTPRDNEVWGGTVFIAGSRVLISGRIDWDSPGPPYGSLHLHDLNSQTPLVPVFTLKGLGAVALSEKFLVVGHADAERANVYDLDSATPADPMLTLLHPAPGEDDDYGSSVAISGSRVVVGASGDVVAGRPARGSVFVYDMSGPTPTTPALTLNNPSPPNQLYFGSSVIASGSRLLVNVSSAEHSCYVYDLASPMPIDPILAVGNLDLGPWPEGIGLRKAFAFSGMRLAVGVYPYNPAPEFERVYVFELDGATPTVPATVLDNPTPGPHPLDQFAASVAIDGDLIAVGAPYDDSTAIDSGSVFIFGPNPLDRDSDGLLDSWELSYWPTTGGHGALDDFDHDNSPELVELAFGLNPTLPDTAGLPAVSTEGGFLTMTVTKRPGVTYEIQSAGTLLAGKGESFSSTTTVVLIDTPTTLKARDTVSLGARATRFLRAKVTAAP